ncbi:MAG: peptide deformylase [Pseudomonadota bacterium]
MNLYDIIIAPDPALKAEAQAINDITDDVRKQMDRMLATMYDAPGIGLAANQVGLLNRVVVMDVHPDSWAYAGEDSSGVLKIESQYRSGEDDTVEDRSEETHPLIMANPEIVHESEQRSVFDEGCLSLPGQFGTVERPAKVRVKYLDYDGKQQELEAEGLLSHCIQHEMDHLDGILFVDYLSSLKRNMIIRKMEKLKKQRLL